MKDIIFSYIKQHKTTFYYIIIFLFIGSIFYGMVEDWYVKNYGIYTIGVIKNIRRARGGYKADIYYSFDGKNYKGYSISPNFDSENKRFYIQFVKKFPGLFYIVGDEVPSYVKDVPDKGWVEQP